MSEEFHMEEKDVIKYLKRNKDNIIIAFGQKIHCSKRSEIKSMMENKSFCYTCKDKKKFYQVMGRHLVSKNNIDKITNNKFSIFNISLLVNVISVSSEEEPERKHNRSVYDVDAYSASEYEKLDKVM